MLNRNTNDKYSRWSLIGLAERLENYGNGPFDFHGIVRTGLTSEFAAIISYIHSATHKGDRGIEVFEGSPSLIQRVELCLASQIPKLHAEEIRKLYMDSSHRTHWFKKYQDYKAGQKK